jgi:hypothetical protein
MIIAMLMAHLVSDFLLQTDTIARWKVRELRGVLVHGTIVLVVTLLFAVAFDPTWWPWALFIGLSHTLVDSVTLWLTKRMQQPGTGAFALARFAVDQAIHLSIIIAALVASGYLEATALITGLHAALRTNRSMAFALGYVFITMPAWILVEFAVYGLVNSSAPDFSQTTNKYVGILERGLITTFVVTGQLALAPMVALPRLVLEGPQVMGSRRVTLYVAELLANVMLAFITGLALRWL